MVKYLPLQKQDMDLFLFIYIALYDTFIIQCKRSTNKTMLHLGKICDSKAY